MEIYFDGVLVNTDYYAGLTKSATVFEDSFRLGKTICETYKLTLNKESNLTTPQLVTLYQDNVLVKTLYVDDVEEDDFTKTYSLVDGMVKFNFPYDASQIITGEETTLLDIFNDICEKANIDTDIDSFNSDDMIVTWFDNTMTGRTYLGFIAELNSSFLYMTADNKLAFKPLVQQPVKTITFDEISDYKIGTRHEISRVVYDNTYNVWTYGNETGETYYVDTSNVYLINTEQVETIYNEINGLVYYNFKSQNLPIYDLKPGDLVRFTDGTNNYDTYVQYNDINFSGNRWYGGCELDVKNNQQEETEIIDTKDIIKAIKVTVDRDGNQIRTLITDTENIQTDLRENYYTLQQTNELVQSSASGVTNTFSEAGGNNIFRNTGLWHENTSSDSAINPYEFWNGIVVRTSEEKAVNMNALLLQNTTVYQEQIVPNGKYTVSFKYKKLISLADVKVIINDVEYTLSGTDETDFITGVAGIEPLYVNSQHINIQFVSDIDNSCEIYDLMVNAGSVKLAYSQNQNETTTNTVNIGKGITISSTDTKTIFKANADGIRTLDENGTELTKFTDTGMTTKKIEVSQEALITGMLIQEVGEQTWLTRL